MAEHRDLPKEWESFSGEWIARCEAGGDGAREGLLDEWMLDIVGDVAGASVINFHRMLSTTMNAFLAAGFTLRRLHEPLPTKAQLERVPGNDDLFRVPIFVIYELAKPVAGS